MTRWAVWFALLHTLAAASAPAAVAGASAGAAPRFALPPVHAPGADHETAAAFDLVLRQELQRAVPDRLVAGDEADHRTPCVDAECAAAFARRSGAEAALLCTLARFGDSHVATLAWIELDERIVWSHRVTARRPEDLPEVAERFAVAVATGQLPKSRSDKKRPSHVNGSRRRAANGDSGAGEPSREGDVTAKQSLMTQGPRFGTIHPVGGSYAGVPSLMSFAWVWRHQTPHFTVDAVPLLGLAWGGQLASNGGEARDWSILDLFVSWTPFAGDIAPVMGAGIGLHGLRLQRETPSGRRTDNELAVSLAAGGGLVLFRNYDFQISFDARYHVVLDRFSSVDGKGAHGFALTFGLQRR